MYLCISQHDSVRRRNGERRAATATRHGGVVIGVRTGDLFCVPPNARDTWVDGDEPYVSLRVLGARHFASAHAAPDPGRTGEGVEVPARMRGGVDWERRSADA